MPSVPFSWSELFADRYELMQGEPGFRIQEQYEIFASDRAPKVVEPKIKEIPIEEIGEELIDLRLEENPRIGMMPNPGKPFESPDCNSGLKRASKLRKGIYDKLKMMIESLDRLAPAFGYEAGQVDIKVFEGLRDLATQKELYEKKLEEIRNAFPSLSLEEAKQETCKWVSPVENNVPVHSTGAAVDLRLWDNKAQTFLDLGQFGVIWGLNPNAPTFSEGISKTQKLNRFYCSLAAAEAGLTNYMYEFWHFSSGDRYDAWVHNKPQAHYGPALP